MMKLNERRAAMGERTYRSREELIGRIEWHVKEIELICGEYDLDPTQWLADNEGDEQ